MANFYRINEILKLTSVSLRTLHYYDEINLLSPSYRTEGGHRLYSNEDLMKLQKIVTLKFMGFSLKKIQNLLDDSNFNVHASLKAQAEVIKKEAARMESVSKLLNYLAISFPAKETVEWNEITNIIAILQLNESERKKWYEKYLSQIELNEMNQLFLGYTDEFWKDYHKRWADLLDEVKQNLSTDPESDIGIQLAKKWMNLVNEIYAGNSELSKKLWEGYKAGIIPENQLPHDQFIIAYITKAYKKLNRVDPLQ